MDASPVLRCSDWDGLIAAVAAATNSALAEGLYPTATRAVLAAPAALALWIASREPHLAARPRLRLLVIGAETVDAADQGRWYTLISHLLGARLAVDTTLVGDALDPTFNSAAASLAPPQPANLLRMELSEFLCTHDAGAFDLAAVFHPGMQKNRGWLTDASLARIISTGTPLVASSYEPEEAQVDGWVIESHGYAIAGEPLLNPFYLDLSHGHTQVHWGRALWKFARQVPAPGLAPDSRKLDALDLLSRMVMHSMIEIGRASFAPGARIELRSSAGTRLALIHIFDRCCVDPATRRLLRLAETGELEETGMLNAEDMASYPAAGRDLERALWAARIKADRFLPDGDLAREPGYGSSRAAGMLDTLRERGRRLFQGEPAGGW